MRVISADTVIIGSGIAGTLVARELARAGGSSLVLERGAFVPWKEQYKTGRWERESPVSRHDHEVDPAGQAWPWTYVYSVGGSTNRWREHTPRFLPEDFELRSRYGALRDWPISYEDLSPYYSAAERAMAIAGAPNQLMPGTSYAQPAHPLSPRIGR